MNQFLKKVSLTALGAAFAVGMAVSGAAYSTAAYADENDGIMTISHTVEMPTFEAGIETYCMVAYPIVNNDVHSNKVYLCSAPGASGAFSLTYHENSVDGSVNNDDTRYYLVHSTTSSETCSPLYKYAKAYCATCGNYSGASYLSYVEEARFPSNGYTSGSTVIKTSYTTACTWTFSASVEDTCLFSLAYNGEVEDISKELTSSAKTYSYTLDGVKFYIQLSTTSVRIKASEIITSDNFNTMFAFYIEN